MYPHTLHSLPRSHAAYPAHALPSPALPSSRLSLPPQQPARPVQHCVPLPAVPHHSQIHQAAGQHHVQTRPDVALPTRASASAHHPQQPDVATQVRFLPRRLSPAFQGSTLQQFEQHWWAIFVSQGCKHQLKEALAYTFRLLYLGKTPAGEPVFKANFLSLREEEQLLLWAFAHNPNYHLFQTPQPAPVKLATRQLPQIVVSPPSAVPDLLSPVSQDEYAESSPSPQLVKDVVAASPVASSVGPVQLTAAERIKMRKTTSTKSDVDKSSTLTVPKQRSDSRPKPVRTSKKADSAPYTKEKPAAKPSLSLQHPSDHIFPSYNLHDVNLSQWYDHADTLETEAKIAPFQVWKQPVPTEEDKARILAVATKEREVRRTQWLAKGGLPGMHIFA